MAMSDAERKRRSRARQKGVAKAEMLVPSETAGYLKRSFAEFVSRNESELLIYENLDAFGVFIAGTGLDQEVQEFDSQFERDEPLSSLERAIGLVDVFIDAAAELAALVNSYKLGEIEVAIDAAVTASANLPRGDVDALRRSFDEIERLKMIRTQLRRPYRHTVLATCVEAETEVASD